MPNSQTIDRNLGRRSLPVTAFIVVVVVWLAILRVVGQVTKDRADVHNGRLLTDNNVIWTLIVPVGAACAFAYLMIAVLGWWRPVFYDPKPVRRWVWIIPLVFAIGIAGGINYHLLGDRGGKFTLLLLAGCLLVGFSEEGMFRCIGVTSFRRQGFTEGKVALWTSILFGLVHLVNAIGGSSGAYLQAFVVMFAGYFFYLIRRVSRGNILNSILHGLFDFTLLSGSEIIPKGDKAYAGAFLGILVYIVCAIILVVRRHRIELPTTATPQLAEV
jgi:hypothetical protein